MKLGVYLGLFLEMWMLVRVCDRIIIIIIINAVKGSREGLIRLKSRSEDVLNLKKEMF